MIERFYAQYHDELTGWCRSMTGDPALAEDLVQEAFLRGLLNSALLQTFPERQLRAWFYRTIRNLYLDRLRHARFETLPDTVPETGHLSEEYARIDWQQLLDSLPGEEGMLFGLRYLSGYTSREIGDFLGIPPGTVRARLSLAKKHLQAALKDG